MTFSFPRGESQMCPSSLDSTQLSVKFRGLGVIRDVAYKQPVIIPPQLRGLVSFSHSLYTLQHLYDKKVGTNFFLMSKQQLSTPTRQIFQTPGHWDVRLQSLSSVLVKPFGAVFLLVTVRVCVSVFMCACIHALCIHNLLQAISYFNTTECSSYTQIGRERSLSLNASSCSNGTTLDYNCQEKQLEKRTKTWPNSQTKYFTVFNTKML